MEKEMIDILKSTTAYFGRQRENIAREVIFDITSLKREFPDAVYSLVLRRIGETETYTAVATTIEGNEFRYQPTFWATEKAGVGNWEIHAIDADTGLVAKTITGTFNVDPALNDANDAAPEVAENWLTQVTEARDEAVDAARRATESVSIDVDQIREAIANKLDKPDDDGINGQLLMSDGVGGQRWADPPETYVLPAASTRRMGGVIVGDGLRIDGDGKLTAESFELATEERNGMIRAIDQKKLNTIEEHANHYVLPKATFDTVGGIQVGDNLTIDENGRLSAEGQKLLPASNERLGGIVLGDNMSVDQEGKLSFTVPKASANSVGGIKVGRNLSIEEDGTLNSNDSYELPTATATRLGGIRVGNNLTVDEHGVLSADAQPIQPATEDSLGGIKIGNNLSIDEMGIASAYSYDINKTLKEDGKTYQLNLIRSDGNEEEIVQSVDLPAGGGGGGGGSSAEGFFLNIERVTASPIIATSKDSVKITVDIQSREGSDPSSPFIDGTYVWKIGTTILQGLTGAYSKVRNTFDLTPYLSNGTQRVSLTVTQSDSRISQTRTWNVQIVDVRLESDFMDEYTYPANEEIAFTYVPYGAVPKKVHFKLDGTELEPVDVPANISGTTQMYIIPAHTHGTRTLEVWMVAIVGIDEIPSNHIYKDLIWYDENADTPIISCAQKAVLVPDGAEYDKNKKYYTKENGLYNLAEVDSENWDEHGELYYMDHHAMQFSSTPIRFNVYDPKSPTPEVTLYEDGIPVATRTLPESMNNIWSYQASTGGIHTLTIVCKSASVDIIMDIQALDMDVTPVTANLVFDFNPAGRSNDDNEHRMWEYTNSNNDTYSMTVSPDFDWVNGGYQRDDDGNTMFLVKAGTWAKIDCKIFQRASDMVKRNGQHFKVIFRVNNVRDASTTWLNCIGQNGESEVGLRMNVREAYLYSGNSAVNSENPSSLYSPYAEEDRVEYEYDIHPLDTSDISASSYFMSYEDGTMFRPIVYDNSNILQQLPASDIRIGSNDCDVCIYRMKLYNSSLSNEDVMNNFIADAPSGEEMYERYTRNQIYDQDGYLTAEHLAEVCPDLRIIKISAPHFTNKKKNTVADTTIQCIYKNGDPVLDNWTVTGAGHSGQGTTSDNYGVSGRNIDLKMKVDESLGITAPVCTFGDGSQSDPGKVSISLTRDSIPVNYFNIKVNIASSENANNALLQKRYDRYLPYNTPAHKRDYRVKNDMEFFNCVVFIQETGDMAIHEEFADNNWHFYAIGNIGDSKKTDKTRVYTPDDPNEYTVEIIDNTCPNSRFDTGVYNLLVPSVPSTGEWLLDYYTQNADGTFTLRRYLDNAWTIVKEDVSEIVNGAVAVLNQLPTKGLSNIEYYIQNGSNYTMYSWRNGQWSIGAAQTEADLNDAKKRHMSTAIDPRQWGPGNEKYEALLADEFNDKKTYELRYEGAEKSLDDPEEIARYHEQSKDIFRQMYAWVVTSTDEEFVSGLEHWCIKDAALYWYLFTEQYTMMDNRAKNSFWHWAKHYVSRDEYNTSDICYNKVKADSSFDKNLTYYTKESGTYSVWNGNQDDWAEHPRLYIHNDYYTVDNTQASYNNGYRFDYWDYDNDSAIGINNTGALGLSYGKEDIDRTVEDDPTSKNVYNAADSVFWRRIRLLCHDDLAQLYQRLENNGCWTASGFIKEFDDWQNQWPEALWTKDAERKYIRPYLGTSYDNSTTKSADGKTIKKDSQYLVDMLNGRKKYQRRQWIRDQVTYMGTKYLASSITNNCILLRCYEPSGAVVTPDYTLRIVPFSDMYLSVMFGSGNKATQVRAKAGTEYELKCPIPMSGATDIPFYIYAASNIQELSDLSACYFTTNNFASATKLKKLKIGSDTPGYSNQIEVLNLGTGRHDLLEILDVTNCRNLVGTSNSGTMNLAGCGRLREFYASGTSISSVIFATNGQLEIAVMPESLTGLTMIGLDKLVSFTANYDHLVTLNIEGGTIDARAIVADAYDTIRSLRVVEIDWTGTNSFPDTKILNALSDLNNMYDTYLSGKVNIANDITQSELDHYHTVWPYLDVLYESITPEYLVEYINKDGSLLGYEEVTAGSYLTNPIGRIITGPSGGHIEFQTPTMPQTEQYTFEFREWDTLEGPVTRQRKVYALYDNVTRRYTVNWYGKVNGLKLASGEYEYGSEAVYEYTPSKDENFNPNKTYYYQTSGSYAVYNGDWDERPDLFEKNDIPIDVSGESREIYRLFAGWDKSTGYVRPDTSNVDGHVDVYAVWEECDRIPEAGIATDTLTASQVYAITRQNNTTIKRYFNMEKPDYVTITLGRDPEFTNVESLTLIDNKRWFDGTSGEILLDNNGQPIRLFAKDAPSFTIAIDFEMRNSGSIDNEKTLIGCYAGDGRLGFRLKCGYRESDDSYRPVIEWGGQSFDVGYSYEYNDGDNYYDARYRDMVVIRHIAGDQTLYVYTSNVGQYFNLNGITRYSKTRANYASTDTPLVVGGVYIDTDEEFNNNQYGTGYIYWCKLWFDDLGEYNCRQIASWPHEVLNMEYYGTQRYYLVDGGRSTASFISRKPLYGRAVQANSNYSEDAIWSNCPARQFLSNRIIDALPIQWQVMLRTVKLYTVLGSGVAAGTELTEDKVYLPAYAEVYPITSAPFIQEQFSNSSNEGTMITWFSDHAHRAKSKVLDIRANPRVWTGISDPTTQIGNDIRIGDIWVQEAMGGYPVYIFVDNESIARDHLLVKNNTTPNEKGGWVQSASMWGLRTPYSGMLNNGHQYQYYCITALGAVSTYPYTTSNGYGDGIAIDFCFSI